jgi:hypothetical protein
MAEDALTIPNQHSPQCGRLPQWALVRPVGAYLGYYENPYGEQWVLVASEDKVLLAGGDCGWEQAYELLRPPWDEIGQCRYPEWPNLVMTPEERSWLLACLAAAAQRFFPRIPPAGSGAPEKRSPS